MLYAIATWCGPKWGWINGTDRYRSENTAAERAERHSRAESVAGATRMKRKVVPA